MSRELRVNKQQWTSLSIQDRQMIISTLIESGLVKENDEIIGDEEIPTHTNEPVPTSSFAVPLVKDGACEASCTIAYEAACVACGVLTGLAAPVCYGVASAAYGACLKECIAP